MAVCSVYSVEVTNNRTDITISYRIDRHGEVRRLALLSRRCLHELIKLEAELRRRRKGVAGVEGLTRLVKGEGSVPV